jgi:hypothetical protein
MNQQTIGTHIATIMMQVAALTTQVAALTTQVEELVKKKKLQRCNISEDLRLELGRLYFEYGGIEQGDGKKHVDKFVRALEDKHQRTLSRGTLDNVGKDLISGVRCLHCAPFVQLGLLTHHLAPGSA